MSKRGGFLNNVRNKRLILPIITVVTIIILLVYILKTNKEDFYVIKKCTPWHRKNKLTKKIIHEDDLSTEYNPNNVPEGNGYFEIIRSKTDLEHKVQQRYPRQSCGLDSCVEGDHFKMVKASDDLGRKGYKKKACQNFRDGPTKDNQMFSLTEGQWVDCPKNQYSTSQMNELGNTTCLGGDEQSTNCSADQIPANKCTEIDKWMKQCPDKTEYMLSSLGGAGLNVIISGEVMQGYEQKVINDDAFRSCEYLTYLTIRNSVFAIGYRAFSDCKKLRSVTFSGKEDESTLYSIGEEAFKNCNLLPRVKIPDSVEMIGKHAFQNCSNLRTVTLPANISSIGDGAFSGCTNLRVIKIDFEKYQQNIGTSPFTIGKNAFRNTKLNSRSKKLLEKLKYGGVN